MGRYVEESAHVVSLSVPVLSGMALVRSISATSLPGLEHNVNCGEEGRLVITHDLNNPFTTK